MIDVRTLLFVSVFAIVVSFPFILVGANFAHLGYADTLLDQCEVDLAVQRDKVLLGLENYSGSPASCEAFYEHAETEPLVWMIKKVSKE